MSASHENNHDLKHTHPYVLYIVLTLVLFLFLVGAGYLALKNGWIPNR